MAQVKLVKKKQIAGDTLACYLEKPDNFNFLPGQHISLIIKEVKNDPKGNKRIFSIASSPKEKELMIATRIRDTPYKKYLAAMKEGTELELKGPMGSMILEKKYPAVFLTGGIGITPFRSMIQSAREEQTKQEIFLFYANKTRRSLAFEEDINAWSKNKNIKIIKTFTEDILLGCEQGHITEEMLRKYILQEILSKAFFYIAGPQSMILSLLELLRAMKVKQDRIKTEEFTGY